jgi:AAA domain/Bifunctional DNA primase/polymerase, N-terminal
VDDRPDELLEEGARFVHRHDLAPAWTDGIEGADAKRCRRNGWKKPKRLNPNDEAAVGYFVTRARKANPALPAFANTLVLVEVDLDVPEDAYPPLNEVMARVAGLMRRLGLRFPETTIVHSRRGLHFYFRPPDGFMPAKVQLAEAGDAVTWSTDGYVVAVPGVHERRGVVYEFVRNGAVTMLPAEMYERLHVLAGESRVEARRAYEAGEPIPTGSRRETIFSLTLERVRDGVDRHAIVAELLELNTAQCSPSLKREQVEEQIDGAIRWAYKNPTETEKARAEAKRILAGARDAGATAAILSATPKRKRRMQRRPLEQVQAEPVEWLIEKVVPLGAQVLLAGVGGLGKSGLLLAWAKEITLTGRDVLIISYEDQAAPVLRPRFEAVGGDLARLHELYVDELAGSISFPDDLPELDRHVRETGAAAVLIDPVSASIDLKLDAHKDQDVRVVLGQLARLADRERIAIVENAHMNKAASTDPYLRINGSTAFYNAARSVLTVTRDPAEPDWQRLVTHHKSNYGPLAEVERWRVVPVTITSKTGPIEVMTMEFVEIADDVDRDTVLATPPIGAPKIDEALEFLVHALADGAWHDSVGLKKIAAAQQISERTLKRAAQELEVEHERRGYPASTYWRLHRSGQSHLHVVGPTGEPG